MGRLVLLAIAILSTSCQRAPALRTAQPPGADAGNASLVEICERLQRAPIEDGLLPEVNESLKNSFPEWAQTRQTDPLAKSSWPHDFSGCVIEAHNEITVSQATCVDFRDLLVHPGRWSQLYTNAHAIEAPATLTPGTQFKFKTFGSRQSCTVKPEENRNNGFTFGWTCENTYLFPIPDNEQLPSGRIYHRWNCTETNGEILISTQECQVGPAITMANVFLKGRMIDMMQRGHQAWLEGLKCKLNNGDWSVQTRAGA